MKHVNGYNVSVINYDEQSITLCIFIEIGGFIYGSFTKQFMLEDFEGWEYMNEDRSITFDIDVSQVQAYLKGATQC